MDHAGYRRLAAGAVVDDLDRDEAAELAAHVSRCMECRMLGDELVATAGDLALVARRRRPPPTLRAAVMAAVRSADATTVTDGSTDGSTGAPGLQAVFGGLGAGS